MWRTGLLVILLIALSACSLKSWIAPYLPPPTPMAATTRVISPGGRFTVELFNYAAVPADRAFDGFTVYDQQTGLSRYQSLSVVPVPYGFPSGISFDWTPSEHYLWVITDELASSHGCDELFVYTGNGSHLVFDSAMTTSLCRSIEADASIEIIAVCSNDDILFYQSGTYRLTPSTGIYTTFPSIADAKC